MKGVQYYKGEESDKVLVRKMVNKTQTSWEETVNKERKQTCARFPGRSTATTTNHTAPLQINNCVSQNKKKKRERPRA